MTDRAPHDLATVITPTGSALGESYKSRATWFPTGSLAHGTASRTSRCVTPRFGREPLWFQIGKSYGWKNSWQQ